MENKQPKLEDYSKEVLIYYINNYCFCSFDELEHSKWSVEVDKLIEESRKISEEKSKLTIGYSKWLKLTERYNKIQERLDKLLNLNK
jgi:hypothetical protein